MAKKSFLSDLLKLTDNPFASVAEMGIVAGDITGYIDTGSYALNCLLSGSPFRGLAKNKILGLAGEESTGKTFYSLAIAKNFQVLEPDGAVVDFTTESDFGKENLERRGIDNSRFGVVPVETVEEFRTQCMKMIEAMSTEAEPPKALFILDSLGNLSTLKEIEDIKTGTNKRDMTKQQLLRGAFRALTLKLGKLQIPMIVLNHTYEVVGAYIPTKEMCLVAGTQVLTPSGDVGIDELKIGELVHTLDGPMLVSETHEYDAHEIYELEFDDGTTVECTADHKFLIKGEWVRVADLAPAGQNTETLNIEVASLEGDLDVYRQQIHENLYEDCE